MTAQAADNKKAPFCDNPKCNFHRVNVSDNCIDLHSGDIKIDREFFGNESGRPVRLCGVSAEVVPMFVRFEAPKHQREVLQPEKQIIIVDSI